MAETADQAPSSMSPLPARAADLVIAPVSLHTRVLFSAILEEARAWQADRGSEGWTYAFDDAWMFPRIERRELFLAFIGGEPVAAFRLLWEDRPFWGEREVGDSIYLHTFAVRRDHAGTGLGAAIIERVAELGRERGRATVRLDCSLSSARLIAFYERNGFVSVGTIFLGGRMMNLMERPIPPAGGSRERTSCKPPGADAWKNSVQSTIG